MPATAAIEAPLIEIFSSLQGEGVFIGCRQIFVRFASCNFDCSYCDTPFQPSPTCRVESVPGSGNFSSHDNPVKLDAVSQLISDWNSGARGKHHSLVLTGGEPLLHAEVLRAWLPSISRVLPIYLETNGTLANELVKILPFVTWVSMDIKGGDVTGLPTPWLAHTAFLKEASAKLCQVKLVVDASTSHAELLQAAALVTSFAPLAPFVLQPRTVAGRPALSGLELLGLQTAASAAHADVRVIPQVHPWLGVA